ncbi:Transcription factor bHLH93 [Senna tora]|uniref:Transcription factor bHLH93 n=1 Tax=Senna tora TaxID=362788 RepID=A0A834U0W3_9FABA|nr:Transcription factor bHLH93 [Senna tora]
MEMYGHQHDFMEELLGVRRETWDTTMPSPSQENQFFFSNTTTTTTFDCFDPDSLTFLPNTFSQEQLPHHQSCNNYSSAFNEIYSSLLDEFSAPHTTTIDSSASYSTLDHSPPFLGQEDIVYPSLSSMMEDHEGLFGEEFQSLNLIKTTCKIEPISISHSPDETQRFNLGTSSEIRSKNRPNNKRVQGQPSKNLMAERRRRKRLNDRLSMLRSIVPKISKMDRTSILGDTIDYMKELLEKIKSLQQQMEFDVERRNVDTKVEIFCTGKPGLLLSTVNTLEALGLEIQQCVISCFNDFTELEQRTILSSEDIKQALFRNAGYGGRCL